MVHAAHVGHLPDGVECQEGLKFRFVPQSFRKKRFTIYIMNEVTNCLRVQGRRKKGKEKKEGREEGEGERKEGRKGGGRRGGEKEEGGKGGGKEGGNQGK